MSRRERQRERNRQYKRKKREEREAALRNGEDLSHGAAGQAREGRATVVTVNGFDREVDALERVIRNVDRELGLDRREASIPDERVGTPSVGGSGECSQGPGTKISSLATTPGGGEPPTSTKGGIAARRKSRSRSSSASSTCSSSSNSSSSSSSSSGSSASSSSSNSSGELVGDSLTDQSASRPASSSSGYSSVDAPASDSRPSSAQGEADAQAQPSQGRVRVGISGPWDTDPTVRRPFLPTRFEPERRPVTAQAAPRQPPPEHSQEIDLEYLGLIEDEILYEMRHTLPPRSARPHTTNEDPTRRSKKKRNPRK